jgi:hypothetical protein
MVYPDCKECKWFKECAVRYYCLPLIYCQYQEIDENPYQQEE